MNTNLKCIDINGTEHDIDIQHIQAIKYQDTGLYKADKCILTIYYNGKNIAYLVDGEAERVMLFLKPEYVDNLKLKKQIGSARVDSPVDFFNDNFLSRLDTDNISNLTDLAALADSESESNNQSRYTEAECIREVVDDFEMAMPYMLGNLTDEDVLKAAEHLLWACRCAVVNEYVKVGDIDKFERDLDTHGSQILFSNTCDNVYTRVFNDVYEMVCNSSYEIDGLNRIKYDFHKLYLRFLQYGVTHGLANDMDLQSV